MFGYTASELRCHEGGLSSGKLSFVCLTGFSFSSVSQLVEASLWNVEGAMTACLNTVPMANREAEVDRVSLVKLGFQSWLKQVANVDVQGLTA
ncbi:hypothetical protein EC839_113116 [Pseudomonas sp. JUb52]|nr:hypothetical protein EC839_113116 [Pseudomonas sp. JUb52]